MSLSTTYSVLFLDFRFFFGLPDLEVFLLIDPDLRCFAPLLGCAFTALSASSADLRPLRPLRPLLYQQSVDSVYCYCSSLRCRFADWLAITVGLGGAAFSPACLWQSEFSRSFTGLLSLINSCNDWFLTPGCSRFPPLSNGISLSH